VRDDPLRRTLGSPWPYAAIVIAGIAVGTAFAPLAAVGLVAGLAGASLLVWRFGAVRGLWYLVLLTLPIKEPLSFDIHGTVSLYPTDFLMVMLCARVVTSAGPRELWKKSRSLRIEILIVALSVAGLYTATKFFWGVASVYRLVMLVVLFLLARVLVSDREEAVRSFAMVCLSMLVPIAVGFYQASLPFGAVLPDWGFLATAYDAGGNPSHRAFSTLNHPLNFSHYLTIGFGVCLGLASGLERLWHRVALVVIAGLAVICNLYTYSMGGILGMVATLGALVVLRRSTKLFLIVLVALVVVALVAPPALVAKVDRLFSGEALTAAARLVTYQQAFMVIRDHPLFGLGWGGIRTSLEFAYRISRADAVAFTAENYFLQRAIAVGLVGLALYVVLWYSFLRNVRDLRREWDRSRGVDPVTTAMVAAAVAFLVQGQVMPATNVSTNSVLWLMFAAAESLRAARRAEGAE
jgi:O-antigen ligase